MTETHYVTRWRPVEGQNRRFVSVDIDFLWDIMPRLGLKPSEFTILCFLASLENKDREVTASVATLAKRSGMGRKTVQRAITRLVTAGLVSRENRYVHGAPSSNRYKIRIDAEALGLGQNDPGLGQNGPDPRAKMTHGRADMTQGQGQNGPTYKEHVVEEHVERKTGEEGAGAPAPPPIAALSEEATYLLERNRQRYRDELALAQVCGNPITRKSFFVIGKIPHTFVPNNTPMGCEDEFAATSLLIVTNIMREVGNESGLPVLIMPTTKNDLMYLGDLVVDFLCGTGSDDWESEFRAFFKWCAINKKRNLSINLLAKYVGDWRSDHGYH